MGTCCRATVVQAFVRSSVLMEILSVVSDVVRSVELDVDGDVLASISMLKVAGRSAVTVSWVDKRNVMMAMIRLGMGAPQIVRRSQVSIALLLLFLRTLVAFLWIHANQYVEMALAWVQKIATMVIIWISMVVPRYARLNAVSRAAVKSTLQRNINAAQHAGME